MRRNRKKSDTSIPEFTGKKKVDVPVIQLIEYNKDTFHEQSKYDIKSFDGFNKEYNSWLNVYGIHDGLLIKKICQKLNIHPMIIQDIVDVDQHPKAQFIENYGFFVIKSIIPDKKNLCIDQISFIIHENYILSFQERPAQFFEHIRERLRNDTEGIRDHSSDYLLFLFLESILDNYQRTVEFLEDQLDEVASFDMDSDPNPEIIKSIEMAKRQIFSIDKLITPIKDFVLRVDHIEYPFLKERHIKYFGELKYLCQYIADNCDKLELRLDSASNFFFSIQGHRMNQVMKTLTIISVLFIPMTFLTGFYGMNFVHIPGLDNPHAFYIFVSVLIIIAVIMMAYFKRKRWF